MKSVKVTFSIDESKLNEIDIFAENNGMTRSELIKTACLEYIKAYTQAPTLKNLLGDFMKSTGSAISGNMSVKEYREKIDDLQVELDNFKHTAI